MVGLVMLIHCFILQPVSHNSIDIFIIFSPMCYILHCSPPPNAGGWSVI